YATFPKELEPIQMLNVGLTRGHTVTDLPRVSMKSVIPRLARMGLSVSTMSKMVGEMVGMKRRPKTAWKKVALQPIVNYDLFARLYRTHRPNFATFHSNHVAYYMHRFWRAMDPTPFEVPPSDEEREVYGGCIQHGYVVADQILGKLRQLVGPD